MKAVTIILIIAFSAGTSSCQQQRKNKPIEITATWGSARFYPTKKQVNNEEEITLISRFNLVDKEPGPERATYLQYELGKKIKLVIGNDTIPPALFYYVPLMDEKEKEINSKFLISKLYESKTKKIIIEDPSLVYTGNISFK